MKTNYISSSEAVKGAKESVIAKGETNDCVVRAFASAFDVDYDTAHAEVKKVFKREDRKGTRFFMGRMVNMGTNGYVFNDRKIETVKTDVFGMRYYIHTADGLTLRSTTTAYFLKKYPVGTYIVVVRGHAFTIKDGVVIGNLQDAKQRRKHITGAWKIG